MHRFLLSLPWAALAYGAPLSVSHAATVNECLQVAPEAAPAGMSLQLQNTCDFDLQCQLTWRVRCDGDAAAAAPRVHNVALRLMSTANKLLFASGEACG
ncbi:MAG: hypothetical protein ABI281_10200, partial [Caldimonas sp.]